MIKKISFSYINEYKLIHLIAVNLVMAIIYIIAIKFSHQFTSLSGDVASIWFPCSIILPAVLIYGNKIIPGIVIGSILGLIPSVLDLSPSLSLLNQIIFIAICSVTDLIQPFIIIFLLQKSGNIKNIFANLYSVWIFILASIFAPLIPAWIGSITLLLMGIIKYSELSVSIISWWSSCSFAYILFSPPFIISQEKDVMDKKATLRELIFVLLVLSFIFILIFQFSYHVEYLLLLILLWTVFRLPRLYSSLLVSIVAVMAIVDTGKGYGVFDASVHESLFYLQCFIATFSLTSLTLSALLNERITAKLKLEETLDCLEEKVSERTKELYDAKSKLEEANKALEEMANTDGLTKISNRRCFDEKLSQEWTRLYRTQKSLSLLLIDVDCFKLYNDFYGHLLGDECLKKIAQALAVSCMRSSDLVARYGGEEFAILLAGTDIKGAIAVAKIIQAKIKSLDIIHQDSLVAESVTVSIGISSLIPMINQSPQLLIDRADEALYLAKQRGKNQYVVFGV